MTTIAEPAVVPITAPTTGEFKIEHEFTPQGDQPHAIDQVVEGIGDKNLKHQTLLGVTGSGKTFTMASIVEKVQRPTLVIAHNKTLAAQLATEFQTYFPNNSVQYFVSYYDYYQPEAYIPRSDTLHRERDGHQRGDRSLKARGYAVADDAAGHVDRGKRVVHLWVWDRRRSTTK